VGGVTEETRRVCFGGSDVPTGPPAGPLTQKLTRYGGDQSGRVIKSLPGGVEYRESWPSEVEFFRKNPKVAGMAAEDNKVILNPYSNLNEDQKNAVLLNEAARVVMRRPGLGPTFGLTDQQKAQFQGYGAGEDIRATVAARILSNDSSAGTPTQEQLDFVKRLAAEMGLSGD